MTLPETTPRPRWFSRNAVRLIALLLAAGVIGALIASRPTTDPEALAAQVRQYVREFKYEDALRTAEDALQIVKNGGYPPEYVAKFHLLRGQMWHAVYEWDFALTDFDTAIELASDYPEAYYLRGTFFAGRSELDLALADLERAVALDPDGRYAADARAAIATIERQKEALGTP
jgi:tetratricopeptide (TPR) repeat protein